MSLPSTLVADITSKTERMRFLGLLAASVGGGTVVGNLGGGFLGIEGFFIVCMVAGGIETVNVITTFFFLREPQQYEMKEKLNFKQVFYVLTSQVKSIGKFHEFTEILNDHVFSLFLLLFLLYDCSVYFHCIYYSKIQYVIPLSR